MPPKRGKKNKKEEDGAAAAAPAEAGADAGAEPAEKKQKSEDAGEEKQAEKAEGGYAFNVNKALDKAHEGKPFSEIILLPPSALQGLAGSADSMLEAFHVKTIKDLAGWRFVKIARAIQVLADSEEKNKRGAGSKMNFNKAVDKEFEKKALKEILKAPPSALQGLAEWSNSTLKDLKIKTIADLAKWKYAHWAEALVTLAEYENADFSSA